MSVELSYTPDALALAVLLHPHPDFGGDQLHPFIDGLFRRLDESGIGAVRFDFSSAEPAEAKAQTIAAIKAGLDRWGTVPVVLAGYSFGAGIAATVEDKRVVAWYLLAPQVSFLTGSMIGRSARPKRIVVPELDRYSSPDSVRKATSDWTSTTVDTLPDTTHFLGDIRPIVDSAASWIESVLHA
ncbi:MAG TPA: hypothetical protein VE990_08700 [Acidimicrobiales bacterium]|nr:hypothetical protein [Acidimicrobiales bacterium]